MARTRRYIRAGQPHELILRVRRGLPFATLLSLNLILEGLLARCQRENYVILCHMVWMGNHIHIILIPLDTQDCTDFYQELQKKVTESFKRILGVSYLHIWEGDAVLTEIGDEEAMIEKIAYIYANPAKANLVDSIDEYPGLSTWKQFTNAPATVETACSKSVPWIRLPAIEKFPALSLSPRTDRIIAGKLRNSANISHTLTYYPNRWMKAFGIECDAEAEAVRQRIVKRVALKESQARDARRRAGISVLGPEALRRQSIMKAHTPKKRERRIFIYTTIKELRIAYIQEMKNFCHLCRDCYVALKFGNPFPPWPPGAIRPYMAPLATAL